MLYNIISYDSLTFLFFLYPYPFPHHEYIKHVYFHIMTSSTYKSFYYILILTCMDKNLHCPIFLIILIPIPRNSQDLDALISQLLWQLLYLPFLQLYLMQLNQM